MTENFFDRSNKQIAENNENYQHIPGRSPLPTPKKLGFELSFKYDDPSTHRLIREEELCDRVYDRDMLRKRMQELKRQEEMNGAKKEVAVARPAPLKATTDEAQAQEAPDPAVVHEDPSHADEVVDTEIAGDLEQDLPQLHASDGISAMFASAISQIEEPAVPLSPHSMTALHLMQDD